MLPGAWGYTGNPFGDDECGKFYGRSLSIWSALLALQGFVYDGPAGRIGFVPRWQPGDHASLFTASEGYGLFTQKRSGREQVASIAVREGRLRLNEVELGTPESGQPMTVGVKLSGDPVDAAFDLNGTTLRLAFGRPVVVESGQRLEICVSHS